MEMGSERDGLGLVSTFPYHTTSGHTKNNLFLIDRTDDLNSAGY